MEHRVWVIIEGALEEDETFDFALEADQRAEELTEELREKCPMIPLCSELEWEVWRADCSPGSSVGEWAGEEGWIYASSEGEGDQ